MLPTLLAETLGIYSTVGACLDLGLLNHERPIDRVSVWPEHKSVA